MHSRIAPGSKDWTQDATVTATLHVERQAAMQQYATMVPSYRPRSLFERVSPPLEFSLL